MELVLSLGEPEVLGALNHVSAMLGSGGASLRLDPKDMLLAVLMRLYARLRRCERRIDMRTVRSISCFCTSGKYDVKSWVMSSVGGRSPNRSRSLRARELAEVLDALLVVRSRLACSYCKYESLDSCDAGDIG